MRQISRRRRFLFIISTIIVLGVSLIFHGASADEGNTRQLTPGIPQGSPSLPQQNGKPLSEPQSTPSSPANQGAVNPRTGEYYPPSGKGAINPRTGEYYPPSGQGFINPRTGAYYPSR